MRRKCDICGLREATLVERVVVNNEVVEYAFCEVCYKTAIKSAISPYDIVRQKRANMGNVCDTCEYTRQEFEKNFLFGCPDCYKSMRAVATETAYRLQGATQHIGKKSKSKDINNRGFRGDK